MIAVVQFTAVLLLGLFASWLAHRWFDLFDHPSMAFLITFSLLLLYGLFYDRRELMRKRRRMRTEV